MSADALYPEGLIGHMTLRALEALVVAHEEVQRIRVAPVERTEDLERHERPTMPAGPSAGAS